MHKRRDLEGSENQGRIEIGDNTYVGDNSILLGGGGIEIGRKVLFHQVQSLLHRGTLKDIEKLMKDQPTYLNKKVVEDDICGLV